MCVGVRVRVELWFGVEVENGSHFGLGEEDGGGGDCRTVWSGGGIPTLKTLWLAPNFSREVFSSGGVGRVSGR